MKNGKSSYNKLPQWRPLDLSDLDRGIAKMAISPLTKAESAATAIAGELPPPNS